MPPRSTKRAKKPSPKAAKKAKEASSSSPLPSVAEDHTEFLDVDEDATSACADVVPLEMVEPEIVPKREVDDETLEEEVAEKVFEETRDKLIEEEAAAEKEIVPKLEVEETLGEELVGEKAVDETMEEEVDEEKGVEKVVEEEEDVVAEKVDENLQDAAEEANGMEVEPEEEDPEEEMLGDEGDNQIVEEEKGGGEITNVSGDGNDDVLNEGNNVSDGDGDDEGNEEDDSGMYMQAPTTQSKKQKKFEIYVGGLEKGAVEEDLIKVFGEFGEIDSVRIVKHPVSQKSKGFAFIRYTSIEHTKKALAELKDGIVVKGKRIRVSASQDNDTLYLGNICKSWTRDQVAETLKGYGVENIDDIFLLEDPKRERKTRGFAFLEFKSHADAMAAFHRLRKPDAVFGRAVSAKVAFSQTPLRPTEEDLLQVKTVYIQGIPKTWDEHEVEELCKKYGEIGKIQLSRTKGKDFGFVEFTSHDSAVACVEGIISAQLGEDVNVKIELARPLNKSRLAKQMARGGFKLEKNEKAADETGKSKKEKGKAKVVHEKEITQSVMKKPKENVPFKSQDKISSERKVNQSTQSVKGKKRSRKGMDTSTNERPSKRTRNNHMGATTNQQLSKKARNNRMDTTTNQQPSKKARNNRMDTTTNQQPFKNGRHNRNLGKGRGRQSTTFTNPRSPYASMPYARPATHATRYAPPATIYAATDYAGTSGSQHHRQDLEPHAGYIPAAEQVRNPYEYNLGRVGTYDIQPRTSSGYAGASRIPSTHPGYPSYAGYEPGYAYPRSGYPSSAYPSSGAYTYRGAYY